MSQYQYLICPFVTLILCQIIKFIIESIQQKKFHFARLFNGCGGMPSSHTSFSSSITMLIGYNLGFDQPVFAAALVFTFIIAFDAMGLRMESGKQAERINYILDEFLKGKVSRGRERLKEELGHQPLEVLVGLLFGTFMAFLFSIYL